MTREFQVVYAVAPGELRTVDLKAAHKREATDIAVGLGIQPLKVTELRVVLDANQQYFRLEEAVEYLRSCTSGVYELIEGGVLPKAMEGKPVFSRRQLDAVALRGMRKMDPTILKEAA